MNIKEIGFVSSVTGHIPRVNWPLDPDQFYWTHFTRVNWPLDPSGNEHKTGQNFSVHLQTNQEPL